MRWLRSWPTVIPPHRAYVIDELERLIISDYDYTALGAIDEDVCILEWDIALEREDMRRMEAHIARSPERVLVAPYRLYTVAPEPVWCHRRVTRDGAERWIRTGEGACDYFSFGCTYLPRALVRAFLAAPAPARGRSPFLLPSQGYTDSRLHDQTFSVWHAHHAGQLPPRVAWDVCAIHLHC